VAPLLTAAALALLGGLAWLFGIRSRPDTTIPATNVTSYPG